MTPLAIGSVRWIASQQANQRGLYLTVSVAWGTRGSSHNEAQPALNMRGWLSALAKDLRTGPLASAKAGFYVIGLRGKASEP